MLGSRRAFTLIEMLMVIMIMGIVVSVFLGRMSRGKKPETFETIGDQLNRMVLFVRQEALVNQKRYCLAFERGRDNPDRIIIGGGVAEAGEFLFRSIRRTLEVRALDFPMKGLHVVKAKLGNDAGVIGASVLVRRSFS